MKAKVWLLALLLGVCISSHAQKGFFVSGTVSQSHYKATDATIWKITPTIGYHFNGQWATGIKYTIEMGEGRMYRQGGIFGRYIFFQANNFRIFTDASAELVDFIQCPDGGTTNPYARIGFQPGFHYALGKHLAVEFRYLFIGYDGSPVDVIKGSPNGNWKLDLGVNTLQLGLQFKF